MSELFTLLEQKLKAILPGARLCHTLEMSPDNPGSENITIPLNLTKVSATGHNKSPDKPITLCLPANPYAAWPEAALQHLVSEMLNNCELTLALDQQGARYEAYLQQVKTTKEKLLPHPSHRIEGLEYVTHYAPSIGGGGDYFDIVDLRNARRRAGIENSGIFWGISLFDVSGHGPGSAVEVAMIDAILRTYQGGPNTGPGNVMTYLNQHFFTRQRRGDFVTGIICNFDAVTENFTYANAGHLPVIVKRAHGKIETLDDHDGIPIGIDRDMSWETHSISLQSGDTLVMMTDGITEARSIDRKEYGNDSILELLQTTNVKEPNFLLSDFLDSFSSHVDSTESQDDQTLIILQLTH